MTETMAATSISPHQSQYFAYALTRRHSSDDFEKLVGTLIDAQVDLNPHQVEAALFAFQSPFSQGALLADEVGLGKTIEAGLVISQKWAERKRRILVITPANLRKQWLQELQEKFFLPCEILETRSYSDIRRLEQRNPFLSDQIITCSYQFARSKSSELSAIPWDLVVMDEAHRLRNVYKTSNVIGRVLKDTFKSVPKILLTATPLQNSLLELYGLISLIDERIFNDLQSFREQFSNLSDPRTFQKLKKRIAAVCHRTLRKQVEPYVNYTQRHPILQDFALEESEKKLYQYIDNYLQQPNLRSLPSSQRHLITMVLRKLLASSSFAIGGALRGMIKRLQQEIHGQANPMNPTETLGEDFEGLDETTDEWFLEAETIAQLPPTVAFSYQTAQDELQNLQKFYDLAQSIQTNSKGKALLTALDTAFQRAAELGASRKAIVFTESRRTQSYLLQLLSEVYGADQVVLFNGTNSDAASQAIYQRWLARHRNSDQITGSKTADMRSALVEEFRDHASIMIATEAGSEGINLQFCSLVINYDLPWNPQRIEQRIGRCHRYGQKHDVVVVNFVNRDNEADQRVYELLAEKFKLFEGVFGASDEILGTIGSGIDFEKRIAEIYQNCRHPDEIQQAFNRLQQELGQEINEALSKTRQKLLENFDDEVREKLRLRDEQSKKHLGRYEHMLLGLTRHELQHHAYFDSDHSFQLLQHPWGPEIPSGTYVLTRRQDQERPEQAYTYRLGHPLAQILLQQAKNRKLEQATLNFNLSGHNGKISILENLKGQQGWLKVDLFSIESEVQTEDHLVVSALTEAGQELEPEAAGRLLGLPAKVILEITGTPPEALHALSRKQQQDLERQMAQKNALFFEAEAEKLDLWADDQKISLEENIKELDRQIQEVKRAGASAITLEEKLETQRRIRDLEKQRTQARRDLFDAQDDIDARRDSLILELESKLNQKKSHQELFLIQWRLT